MISNQPAHIRKKVASNEATDVTVLEDLVNDPDVNVLKALALNPSTPLHIMRKLEEHPSDELRGTILLNRDYIPDFICENL